mgnify:CR=1 FL=1
MKKIFGLFVAAIMVVSCGTAKYSANDGYYNSDGIGVSVDSDIAWDKAYGNAINKVNLKNSVSVSSNSVREYDAKNTTKGKDSENIRYGEVMTTKSHMDAYGIKVAKQKHRRVREEGKKKYEWMLTIAVPKENVE